MYYQVITYNSVTDTLSSYSVTESKDKALKLVREAEKSGCDAIRLNISRKLPKNFNS